MVIPPFTWEWLLKRSAIICGSRLVPPLGILAHTISVWFRPPRISSQISANSRQCQHSAMLTHRQLDRGVGVFRIASELPFLRWGQVDLHASTCAHGILNMSALEAAIHKEELTASFPIIHLLFHSQSATSGTCQTAIPFLMRSKCGQYFSHIFAMRWPPLHKTEPIEIPKMQTIWQSISIN